jgi:hypothetical protein
MKLFSCQAIEKPLRVNQLLGVKLNDELFLNLCVNDSTGWEAVNDDAHLRCNNFEPSWNGLLTKFSACDDEWCEVLRFSANIDNVILAYAI